MPLGQSCWWLIAGLESLVSQVGVQSQETLPAESLCCVPDQP